MSIVPIPYKICEIAAIQVFAKQIQLEMVK